MTATLILTHFNELFSPHDPGHPLRGKEMNEATVLKDAYVAFQGDKILAIGEGEVPAELIGPQTKIEERRGMVATPGLIDCHTHLVYGGSREHEFSKKLNGMSYLDILAEGGGILSTLKATRESSFDELYDKSKKLLEQMMIHGVTTVEAKSGYGLNWETEKRQLEVVKKLNEDLPVDLVSTFMAAHVIPPEYKENPDPLIDDIITMLPKVKEEKLAEFVDVFCDAGVYSAAQSKRLLEAAKKEGFSLRIHADEIESIGGSAVAAEVGATSAEHLMVITDEDIQKLADAHVIGNLLPATTFSLMEDTYAPARKMMNAGMAITITTDSNPGSCPMANLQFVMQLGCLYLRMTPTEVYNAVTINAAYSVHREKTVGSLDKGKNADLTVFAVPNLDYLLYYFATNHAVEVYKNGQCIVKDRQMVRA
ncbi:imidazolonepropionase [Murdochiella vaginalis]|uniref:imidazolonepropionase n=1 Tax=Murdochiella vaginalis TaxID=1852373 RepID=UPI0008FE3082|nr:imidazolonepropionase [Murdochiella vaginalis]